MAEEMEISAARALQSENDSAFCAYVLVVG